MKKKTKKKHTHTHTHKTPTKIDRAWRHKWLWL